MVVTKFLGFRLKRNLTLSESRVSIWALCNNPLSAIRVIVSLQNAKLEARSASPTATESIMDLQIKKKREITKSPKKDMGGIHISSTTKLKNVEEGSPLIFAAAVV